MLTSIIEFFVALVFILSICPLTNSNVIQFGLMISQTLKVSPFLLNGYGCFCGFGGSGKPIDSIDTCCQEHDECYAKLETINCSSLLVNYKFTQNSGIRDQTKKDIIFAKKKLKFFIIKNSRQTFINNGF